MLVLIVLWSANKPTSIVENFGVVRSSKESVTVLNRAWFGLNVVTTY